MSSLRDIMQRLKTQRQAPSAAVLRSQVEAYEKKIASCTAAMLQYEWAWLQEHREMLELSQAQPSMQEELGGPGHVAILLETTREFQKSLETVLTEKGVSPPSHSRAVSPGEHAWEVSLETVRREWGLD